MYAAHEPTKVIIAMNNCLALTISHIFTFHGVNFFKKYVH